MRHSVLVYMDTTVCNIACRLTNWNRWYNACITNGTLVCQVLTRKVKKYKNWPQWNKHIAHRPLEWSSENRITSLCWSAVHVLAQRSTSIWKGLCMPLHLPLSSVKLRLVTFFRPWFRTFYPPACESRFYFSTFRSNHVQTLPEKVRMPGWHT